MESIEEFHIRKIKWAIEELEMQGKEMTLWNLAEISGVKSKYINLISDKVFNIFVN